MENAQNETQQNGATQNEATYNKGYIMNTIRNSLNHIYASIFVLSVSFFAFPCIANANPDILDKIQADITQEQKASIIAIEELKEACLDYANVPCADLHDKVKFLAWKTVADSYDEYKENCSLPKLDLKTGHYIANTSHLLVDQITGLRSAYLNMRGFATETSFSRPTCYNGDTIVYFAGPLKNDISKVINASPDYISLKRRETEAQQNIQIQKLAEDRAEQKKLEAELAQKRQQEAAERQRKEENRREEERIRAEDEIQKAKDKMGLLSKKIHNELKSWLNRHKLDDVRDIKEFCVCLCLTNRNTIQWVINFIPNFNTVSGYWQDSTLPSDFYNLICTIGSDSDYRNALKIFDKHRKSETPHIVVCDNICSDVVKELPTKKQSLNDFFRNR